MEVSPAVQHSKDIVWGSYMEVVYKNSSAMEPHFQILSNCSHTYYLKCIHKWRSAKQLRVRS